MRGLSAIVAESRVAATKAAASKKQPYVFWNADEVKGEKVSLPFIGSYKPEGWAEVAAVLVDSAGLDDEGPALSQDGFRRYVIGNIEEGHGYGYAVIERGEFQVQVGVFRALPKAHEPGKSEGRRPAKR